MPIGRVCDGVSDEILEEARIVGKHLTCLEKQEFAFGGGIGM